MSRYRFPVLRPTILVSAIAPAFREEQTGTSGLALVGALEDTLRGEQRLLDGASAILVRQRMAIAAGTTADIDDCTYAAQRLLLTLGEARKRRHAIAAEMGSSDGVPLGALIDALGSLAGEAVRRARADLAVAAGNLADELETNREMIDRALAHTLAA